MNCDQDESNIISTTRFWTEKILEDYDNCNRERWKKKQKSHLHDWVEPQIKIRTHVVQAVKVNEIIKVKEMKIQSAVKV